MNEKEYYNLIKPYEDAMQMLLSRLDTLNHTLYESSATHPVPIHNIQSRIKSKKSIEDKLIKKEKKPSMTNAKNYLMDITGARVICYFVNDIYNLIEILKSQTDLIVMKERDYVVPQDVKDVFKDVAAHRMILDSKARYQEKTAREILDEILDSVPEPKVEG